MNRVKHLTMIILKVVFILLCFVLASAMTTLQNAPLARFDEMKGHIGAENCEVLVLSEGDGSVVYDMMDGKILFDIEPFFDVLHPVNDRGVRLFKHLCDFGKTLGGELARNVHRHLPWRDN